jgi:hypothetical protein
MLLLRGAALGLCLVATAASAPALLEIEILGPGASKADPVYGTTVQLGFKCSGGGGSVAALSLPAGGLAAAGCGSFVRVDRTDGVSDTAPFVRIADEAFSFTWAPVSFSPAQPLPARPSGFYTLLRFAAVNPLLDLLQKFPTYYRPKNGPTTFYFGGAVDNRPVPIVASGWSAEYNGTRLTANSTSVTIYYDVSYEDSVFGMAIEDLSPGTARLTLQPENSSAHLSRYDTCRFDRFVLGFNLSASPPQFQSSGVYRQESAPGSIVVSFQQPGIYYYGATPSYQGRVGGSSAGGVYDGRPSVHPTALVLAGPDGGTNNQTIPVDFAGAVHHLKPLLTPRQFCLFERNMTVFSGSQLRIPLCRPDPKMEIPHQPAFTSVVAPSWLTLRGRNNQTCRTCSGPAYVSWLNDTVELGGGRTRYTFHSPIARWSIYNNFVPLFVTFDESHATSGGAGGATAADAVELSVLIHADVGDAATVPLSSWQTLSALCVTTPQLPLPKHLVTSITWSDEDLFLDEATQPEDGPHSFVAM